MQKLHLRCLTGFWIRLLEEPCLAMSEMVSVVKRIYLSLSVCLFVHLCECLSLPLSQTRKQTVVLNGQNSSWANVEAGVSQGFILGPLLFLIYINDLPDNLSTNAKLFSDNTSVFCSWRYRYIFLRLEPQFRRGTAWKLISIMGI